MVWTVSHSQVTYEGIIILDTLPSLLQTEKSGNIEILDVITERVTSVNYLWTSYLSNKSDRTY